MKYYGPESDCVALTPENPEPAAPQIEDKSETDGHLFVDGYTVRGRRNRYDPAGELNVDRDEDDKPQPTQAPGFFYPDYL